MNQIRIWWNGVIQTASEATVSVLDRGFLFGESVYETFRTFEGRPWLFVEHYERLQQSVHALDIELPYSQDELWRACRRLSQMFEGDVYLRIVVTGGQSDIELVPPERSTPVVLIYAKPFQPLPDTAYQEGVRVVVATVRRNPVFSLDPRIKSSNLLNNIFAFREAHAAGATEALMLNYQGWLAEGASSNVFLVTESGQVQTPHLDVGILEGVTRRFVLYLCRRYQIPCVESFLRFEDLLRARECFITSSLKDVLPVTRVDDQAIGDGTVGPVTQQLMQWHEQAIKDYIFRIKEMQERPVPWIPNP